MKDKIMFNASVMCMASADGNWRRDHVKICQDCNAQLLIVPTLLDDEVQSRFLWARVDEEAFKALKAHPRVINAYRSYGQDQYPPACPHGYRVEECGHVECNPIEGRV